VIDPARRPAGPGGGQFAPSARPEQVALVLRAPGPGTPDPASADFLAGVLTGAISPDPVLIPVCYDYRDGAARLQSFPDGRMARFTSEPTGDGRLVLRDESGHCATVSTGDLARDTPDTARRLLAAVVNLGPARDLGAGKTWFSSSGSPLAAESLAHGMGMARTTFCGLGGGADAPTVHLADVEEVEAFATTRTSSGETLTFALARLNDGAYVALEVTDDCTDYGGFEESVIGAQARVGTREEVVANGITSEGRRALGL
jgi:hypothetical protein